jgi:hypothetical protein
MRAQKRHYVSAPRTPTEEITGTKKRWAKEEGTSSARDNIHRRFQEEEFSKYNVLL